jgi:hypothetical protein
MKNIQISDLCPQAFKYVVGYHSHSGPYAGFQILKIVVSDLTGEVRNHLNHMMPSG